MKLLRDDSKAAMGPDTTLVREQYRWLYVPNAPVGSQVSHSHLGELFLNRVYQASSIEFWLP